jgi:hypothetical protein
VPGLIAGRHADQDIDASTCHLLQLTAVSWLHIIRAARLTVFVPDEKWADSASAFIIHNTYDTYAREPEPLGRRTARVFCPRLYRGQRVDEL